ncbi:PREDICTED: LOB domain-containing protein 16-like [Ipomoea nil]|uniref:LOB domain-containing protein 16-like n=1 Tax=Ipomoea nil TaxID=35883 RepID=UPI000900C9FE|nr:PREDICTED: LOB domain-containing protein 16-like [Ipomoea nil]XP_019165075.1 PREDICTED: LOB domain-containing protein 16-like [Ipomoea nil]
MATGTGSPCGACKFLRRKCGADCIFAPYFRWEQLGAAKFAAIHKVFGASNVSKLLSNVPVHDRYEAALTIAYEAQARIKDPVYGCVAHIFALQQQVAYLQAQLLQVKGELAQRTLNVNSRRGENDWVRGTGYAYNTEGDGFLEMMQSSSRKRASQSDLGELQALASRMMKN